MWRRLGIVSLACVLLSGCWLQPGFDGGHTRANGLEERLTLDNVDTLEQAWSAPIGIPEATEVLPSEPLVRGGRAYVSFTERSSFFGGRHGLTALGSTGAPLWTNYGFSNDGAVYSTPASLVGDVLYTSWGVAGGGAPCAFRFERLDPDDGAVVTSQNLYVSSIVQGGDDLAFTNRAPCFGPGADLVLSVRGVNDTAARFTARMPLTIFEEPVATVVDGTVFVVTGGQLYAFAADGCGTSSCAPLWSTGDLDLDGNLSAVVAPDGSGALRAFVVTRTSHELLAIDTATRTVGWRAPLGGLPPVRLAVADGAVFVADLGPEGQQVRAFPAAGCGQPTCGATWATAPTTAHQWAAPTVAGGVLYVADGSDVEAYDAGGCGSATCQPVATVSLGDDARVLHTVVAEGRLYAASDARLTVFAPG
jgi:outer membrane protein assembly factor BamB